MSNEKKNLNDDDKNFNSITQSKKPKTLTYGGEDSHWRGGAQDHDMEITRDEARKNDEKIVHHSKID